MIEEDSQKIQFAVNYILERSPGTTMIYLFGSRAAEDYRSDSDYDMAFLPAKALSSLELFNLTSDLSYELSADVDLIDLLVADEVIKNIVVNEGKLIYASSQKKVDEFELAVVSSYLDLNYFRRGALEDFYSER